MLARPDLRTDEESLRRWLAAAALARPADRGGRVVAVGDPGHPALQALVRWDPAGFAHREMVERQSAHLPPASRLATLTGAAADVESALDLLELPAGAEVLGPVPVPGPPGSSGSSGSPGASGPSAEEQSRAVLRVPRAVGAALSATLVRMQGVRDARKLPGVRVQVDPVGLG
jgi:primosomal protein N' (replication factor Y)